MKPTNHQYEIVIGQVAHYIFAPSMFEAANMFRTEHQLARPLLSREINRVHAPKGFCAVVH